MSAPTGDWLRGVGLIWRVAVLLCGANLPAVRAQTPAAIATQKEPARMTASISGSVTDSDGARISGAHIVFTGAEGITRTVTSGGDGSFELDHVSPGAFQLSVGAAGFLLSQVAGTLQPEERQELSTIVLKVSATEAVEVTVSQREVALEEVHAEEHQRLIGVIPNFFVVYDWQAPPLTVRQKYELSWKTILDPVTLGFAAGLAGVQQATNSLSGYGQGAQGYGQRLGAGLADEALGTLLGGAVFPALLHQDPRYFYKGTGTIRSRLFYALSTAVIAKGDNGQWQPAYASIVGNLTAGALSNAYYPANDRSGVSLTLKNGLLDVALDGAQNVLQEFLLKHLTPKVPGYPAP